MKYHLTPVRRAIIKKTTDNTCCQGCGEKRTLLHCWWECKLVQPLWKIVWRFLKKLTNRSTIWPSNSIFGYIYTINTPQHKFKMCSHLFTHPIVHSSVIYNSQGMEATKMSINGWMDKEEMVCIYMYMVYICMYVFYYIYICCYKCQNFTLFMAE